MTNFCLGDEYLLPTKFFTDGFFIDKVHWFFLEITYNDRLQQYLKSRGDKIREKKFWDQIWGEGSKIKPKTRLLTIFQVWFISFPCNCIQ